VIDLASLRWTPCQRSTFPLWPVHAICASDKTRARSRSRETLIRLQSSDSDFAPGRQSSKSAELTEKRTTGQSIVAVIAKFVKNRAGDFALLPALMRTARQPFAIDPAIVAPVAPGFQIRIRRRQFLNRLESSFSWGPRLRPVYGRLEEFALRILEAQHHQGAQHGQNTRAKTRPRNAQGNRGWSNAP
jgi:hypothetical protein